MERLITQALDARLRPVDVLYGILGPALFQVGILWEKNLMSVAEEHRFTQACLPVINLIARRVRGTLPEAEHEVLLARVPGNEHSLGPKFASIGLASLGIPSRVVDGYLSARDLATLAVAGRHPILGVSISLPGLAHELRSVIRELKGAGFSGGVRVGGLAVNQGLSLQLDTQGLDVRFVVRPRFDESERPIWTAKPAT